MDKQPVGTLPDLTASSLDDEIMVITDSERSTLQKEKISDFLTDITSTDENNSLIKGNDGKLFVSKSIEATDIEGVLDISNIPDIPLTKLPDTGVSAGTYQNPRNLQVNSKGLVISVDNMSQGEISDITPFITNCILANNGAEITTQSYEGAAYVNNGCTVSEAGVASGFGANNFILLNKTMTDANAFVMTIPFKVNSTAGIQPLAAINNQDNCIQLDNGVLALKDNGLELKGVVTVSAATQYYAVLTRTETGYTLELKDSTEPETEALDTINLTSTAGYFGGKPIYLGVDKSGNFLNGEIDLAQMGLGIPGQDEVYWDLTKRIDFETVTLSGSLQVLMPNGRNADQTLKNVEQTITLNDVLLFNNSTGSTKTVLVKEDGEVMIRDFYTESDNAPEVPLNGIWFDTDNNVMNTQLNTYPNFINTGVTINEGVVSGFSEEDYLQLPEQYNLGNNWDITLALTTASTAPTEPTQPTDATTPTDATSDTTPTEPTEATPCGLLGNIEVSGEDYIPDGVGLIYDGTGSVTAVFRRADVYNVRKTVVLSTAYEVQKGTGESPEYGYVQTAGDEGSYVAADTQVYSDPQFSIPLETAAADTWQYTGETQDNTQTIDGFTKTAGSTLVPAETVIYADANCTSVQGTASGTDYVYTGATSVSIIGTLTDTVTAGQENSVVLSYDGAKYKLNTKTLASTDNIRNTIAIPLGKALSTGGYFTGTMNLNNSAFSFWTWNGVDEAIADLVPFVGVKIGTISTTQKTVGTYSIGSVALNFPLNIASKYDIKEVKNEMLSKADVNLSNSVPSQSFKDMSISWGMPDLEKGIQLATLDTWILADRDCYVYLLLNTEKGSISGDKVGISVSDIISDGDVTFGFYILAGYYGTACTCICPKGCYFKAYTNGIGSPTLRIYPLKGENNA